MKKLFASLFTATILSATVLSGATKILTIDMQKVFNEYYKVVEAQAKFQTSVKNANQEVELMVKKVSKLLLNFKISLKEFKILHFQKMQRKKRALKQLKSNSNFVKKKRMSINTDKECRAHLDKEDNSSSMIT